MKFFKKLFAVLISAVMALGIFAFAACGGNDDSKPENSNVPEEGGGEINEAAAVAFLDKLKSSPTDAFSLDLTFESTKDYKFKTDNYPEQLVSDNAQFITLARQNHKETSTAHLSVNGNLADGDIDVIAWSNGTCTREVPQGNNQPSLGDHGHEYYKNYWFVRDWNVFACRQTADEEGNYTPVNSFEGKEVSYLGSIMSAMVGAYGDINSSTVISGYSLAEEDVEEFEGGFVFNFDAGELLQSLPLNYVLASLANEAGALTFSSGKVTLNVNKLVYNIVTELKAVIDGLKETSTLGDILANETVKKYLSVFTELFTPEDVQSGIAALISAVKMLDGFSFGEDEDSQFITMIIAMLNSISFDALLEIEPDEGSTTYDYIVKIISSEELGSIIAEIMASMSGGAEGYSAAEAEQVFTLDKLTVAQILEMVNSNPESDPVTLEDIKATFAGLAQTVTANSFSVVDSYEQYFGVTDTVVTTYSGVVLQFNLDANGDVTSQSFTLNGTLTGTDSGFSYNTYDGISDNTYYSQYDLTGTIAISGTLTYMSQKVTLTDISEAVVNEYGYSYEGVETEYSLSVFVDKEYENPEKYPFVQYNTEITVKAATNEAGELIGLYICDTDGERIIDEVVELGQSFDLTLYFTDYDEEYATTVVSCCIYDMGLHDDSCYNLILEYEDEDYYFALIGNKVVADSYTVAEILSSLSA